LCQIVQMRFPSWEWNQLLSEVGKSQSLHDKVLGPLSNL
jgi:hypothetical protein